MIVVAVIAIILTLAIPTYSNYSIRVKISEAITMTEAAKSAVESFCQDERSVTNLNNQLANYEFQASKYVQDIALSGNCDAPFITMTTQATGAQPNPVLTISGDFAESAVKIKWTCVSSGLNIHLPDSCRSY